MKDLDFSLIKWGFFCIIQLLNLLLGRSIMEQVLNNETIEKMTSEIDAKLLEYENNHKSGTGKWYTIDDMNEMIDEVISKHV